MPCHAERRLLPPQAGRGRSELIMWLQGRRSAGTGEAGLGVGESPRKGQRWLLREGVLCSTFFFFSLSLSVSRFVSLFLSSFESLALFISLSLSFFVPFLLSLSESFILLRKMAELVKPEIKHANRLHVKKGTLL